ncbi:MAG TPA: DUF4350 domain-containing protein [Polyangia bacterium]|nr:DUF4350 domain-containing protein [Polyangia bacterium]
MSVRSYFAPLLLLASSAAARAAGDYSPASTEWNGLSRLVDVAAASGCRVQPTDQLDWSELGAHDVLWFVYPRAAVDAGKLDRWLQAGGRAVVADDFGAADAALRALGIRRSRAAVEVPDAARYHHNANLPIARPALATELGHSTDALVANHPASFESAIPPTFAFTQGAALVVEGNVGRGYFVAIADPSVLINNMLELDGNRAFARALVERTCHSGERVVLLTQTFTSRGEPTGAQAIDDSAQPPARYASLFNKMFVDGNHKIAENESRSGFWVLAGFLALIALALVAGAFPGRSRIDDHWTHARRLIGTSQGADGTAALEWQPLAGLPWDYGLAAAILREEVIDRLRLALEQPIDFDWVLPQSLAARVRAKAGPLAGRHAAELWRALHRIRWRTVDGETAPDERIARRRFVQLHALATAFFDALDEPPGVKEV